jgi:hypothetical protein
MHFTMSMSQRVVQRAVEVGSDTEIVVHIIGNGRTEIGVARLVDRSVADDFGGHVLPQIPGNRFVV